MSLLSPVAANYILEWAFDDCFVVPTELTFSFNRRRPCFCDYANSLLQLEGSLSADMRSLETEISKASVMRWKRETVVETFQENKPSPDLFVELGTHFPGSVVLRCHNALRS